jgi:hypothetical protein
MPVRISILVKKLDTVADEKFHEYWVGQPPTAATAPPPF